MALFVKVGTTADFEGLNTGKLVQAGGQSLAVFKVDGNYYAIENTMIRDIVFIFVQVVNLFAIGILAIFARRYEKDVCRIHLESYRKTS